MLQKKTWPRIWPFSAVSAFFYPTSREEIRKTLEENSRTAAKSEDLMKKNRKLIAESAAARAETKPAQYN